MTLTDARSVNRNERASRLRKLLTLVEHDLRNLSLLAETAQAAFDEDQTEQASGLIDRYAALAPITPGLLNISGLIALRQGRPADAAEAFRSLTADSVQDSALRFNLAWALGQMQAFDEIPELLGDAELALFPHGPALKVRALHHLQRLDEALELGRSLEATLAEDPALAGALALAALDAEQEDLARSYVAAAGDTPEGQTVRATLAQMDGDAAAAAALFDQILDAVPGHRRALFGRGMSLLGLQNYDGAAASLRAAAEAFKTHRGSWILLGWTELARQDFVAAQAAFEAAAAISNQDPEAQGGLAVIDVLAGRKVSGRNRAHAALRRDSECLGALLALNLIAKMQKDTGPVPQRLATALDSALGKANSPLASLLSKIHVSEADD